MSCAPTFMSCTLDEQHVRPCTWRVLVTGEVFPHVWVSFPTHVVVHTYAEGRSLVRHMLFAILLKVDWTLLGLFLGLMLPWLKRSRTHLFSDQRSIFHPSWQFFKPTGSLMGLKPNCLSCLGSPSFVGSTLDLSLSNFQASKAIPFLTQTWSQVLDLFRCLLGQVLGSIHKSFEFFSIEHLD